jgi:iron(III) transport system ATP-binding protein
MSILIANNLTRQFAGTTVAAVDNFSLQMDKGGLVALLGESGCGKTTVLRMIAGFERPDSGSLMVYGKEFVGDGLFVEPEKRNIGIVFQDHALFPHLTVEANIGFGLRRKTTTEVRRILDRLLEITGLAELGRRYPHQLSGGQQQRVALARALAPEPKLILLDEPFSSVDTLFRSTLRKEVSEILHQTGTTALLVSHDTGDAFAIADRVVVMRNGVIVQQGSPVEVYRRPVNRYVADFFGPANYILGGAEEDPGSCLFGGDTDKKVGSNLCCVRPEDIAIGKVQTEHAVEARIVDVRFMGEYTEVRCQCNIAGHPTELLVHTRGDFECHGSTCFLQFDASGCTVIRE